MFRSGKTYRLSRVPAQIKQFRPPKKTSEWQDRIVSEDAIVRSVFTRHLTPFQQVLLFFVIFDSCILAVSSQLTSDVIGNTTAASSSPITAYKGLVPAIDITGKKTGCEPVPYGFSGVERCQVDGQLWYMKPVATILRDSLRGFYNMRFARETLGLRVPNSAYFYERIERGSLSFLGDAKKMTFASEAITDFVNAVDLLATYRTGFFSYDVSRFRENVVERIGERGLAQLIVASSFFGDLHSANWGLDNESLVLIDIDQSPTQLKSYFSELRPGEIRLDFSLTTVQEMLVIYNDIADKPLPVLHKSVDMTQERFDVLVKLYQEICIYVLERGQFLNLDPEKPYRMVNNLWSMEFNRRGQELKDFEALTGRAYAV